MLNCVYRKMIDWFEYCTGTSTLPVKVPDPQLLEEECKTIGELMGMDCYLEGDVCKCKEGE